MTHAVLVVAQWVGLDKPYGYSFGKLDADVFWDNTQNAWVAKPTDCVKPFVQSTSSQHLSKFVADIPDAVNAVASNVIVFVHPPGTDPAGGFGVAIDAFKLKSDAPVAGVKSPVVIVTTTVG